MKSPNVATGIFTGFNDEEGIMICGYEWGGNDNESEKKIEIIEKINDLGVTFSNKAPFYGQVANNWPYDRRIRKWFKLWGHELNREGTGGNFEKCLLQTNWCNTQAPNMDKNKNYAKKLLAPDQIKNFLDHIVYFRPKLILFFGSSMIHFLNNKIVLDEFSKTMGPITKNLIFPSKVFEGRRFKVGFQNFEKCKVVSLPHPSRSIGLKDDYINLFSPEIGILIYEVKQFKKVA